MDVPQTTARAITQKPSAWRVALPTLIPLAILLYAVQGTMLIGERYGMGTVPLVLLGWSVLLFGSAAWLNQVLFHRVRTLLPFLAAIMVALLIWFWERQAFAALVPRTGLRYGYFLTPEGASARFWVLVFPFWTGVACLSICFVLALVLGWRTGARSSLACMILWWVAVFVVFALPSMYLQAQGSAAVAI
jgi:hypothetical protein